MTARPDETWAARIIFGCCTRRDCGRAVVKLFGTRRVNPRTREPAHAVYGLCDVHVCIRCGQPAFQTVAVTGRNAHVYGPDVAPTGNVGACCGCIATVMLPPRSGHERPDRQDLH